MFGWDVFTLKNILSACFSPSHQLFSAYRTVTGFQTCRYVHVLNSNLRWAQRNRKIVEGSFNFCTELYLGKHAEPTGLSCILVVQNALRTDCLAFISSLDHNICISTSCVIVLLLLVLLWFWQGFSTLHTHLDAHTHTHVNTGSVGCNLCQRSLASSWPNPSLSLQMETGVTHVHMHTHTHT